MGNLKFGPLVRPTTVVDVPTLVCLNATPRCDCPFCARDPQEPARAQSLTLGDLKLLLGTAYRHAHRSTTLILSRPEPTTPAGLVGIVTYARRQFANIRLDTDGVKLADADWLNELIDAGVSYFASPIYGPRRVHNSLTQTGSYERTLSYMTNLVQAQRGLPRVKLEIQLLLTTASYAHYPALAEQLLSHFGDAAIYAVSGANECSARTATGALAPAAIKPYVTQALELLLRADVRLHLSALPLCAVEQEVLTELLPTLRQQTERHLGCFYYLAPGEPAVQFRTPRAPRSPACLECAVHEICARCMAAGVAHIQENTEPASLCLH